MAQRTITGIVTDAESGEQLISVTVAVKGTSSGAITDLDGQYSVQASEGDTLQFTYIGYDPQEAVVGSQDRLDVSLGTNVSQLEEVVVVGYGKVRKKDLTGSVTTINPDDVQGMPIPRAEQLLQGQIFRRTGHPQQRSTGCRLPYPYSGS